MEPKEDNKLRIDPPFYLASKTVRCWKCYEARPVAGVIVSGSSGFEVGYSALCNIKELNEDVLGFIQKRFPSFQLKYSKVVDYEYYANVCPSCNILTGDFFLHSEPGGAFFPTSEKEAKGVTIEQIPFDGLITVDAGNHAGTGIDWIFEYGKRV